MASGTGEWQGDLIDIGSSGAYRFLNVYETVFDTATGNTTLKYSVGTYVSYGDFGGTYMNSWGSCYDQYRVYGVDIYDQHFFTYVCAPNASVAFSEGCTYYTGSGNLLESRLDITWYPTLPTYTITYNANGGSGAPSSSTKTWGTNKTLSSTTPTRTGYTFKGWATSQARANNGTVDYAAGATYTKNANLSLYAVWQVNTWTVTYNANGGSGAPSSQTKTYNVALTLSTTKPTKTGYDFKGWATTQARANAGTVDYAAGATYNGNAALSLWAAWQKKTYTITYKANGGTGSDFTQTKEYGTALTLASSGFTRSNYTLKKWNTAANGSGTSYALGGSYTSNASATLYAVWVLNAPEAPTGFSVTRASNTKANLSWTRPSSASATWQKVYIYRSVDGGSWASLTNVAGTATSYSDTTTEADHSYRYRIRSYNDGDGGQYSSYATSDTIYNTPAAPSGVTAARVDAAGTNVVLTISNSARTATGFDVQCSTDGSTWSSSGITVTSSTGTPVTSINITMANGGSYYFRVRNKRTSPTALYSAWTASNLVVTIVPPNPPTLIAPASGAVVQYGSVSGTTVSFQWQHNPIDGSAQTAAQLRYSVNGGTSWIDTVTVTTAQTYSLTYAFNVNASVTWQVRTKGAADDYGNWSASSTFAVYKKPTVTITAPSSTIIGVPIHYSATYTDDSGQFASGTIEVVNSGSTVYSETLDAPESGTIDGYIYASEFIPQDGGTYTFKFTVRSNTTLSATAQTTLGVDMELPYIGTIEATNDPETGYVSVVYGWDEESGGQPVASATLYRITDEGRKELATSTTNPASCLDMYAPLNTDYTYLVVTTGTNEAVNQIESANRLNTGWWFVYWNGKIAKAKWNPNGTKTVSRPQQELVDYIGRKFPVSYDGTAVREEGSTDFQIIDRAYAKAFYDMVSEIGSGVYKSGDGEVFHANFKSITTASDHHRNQPYGTLTLPYTRIDGEML